MSGIPTQHYLLTNDIRATSVQRLAAIASERVQALLALSRSLKNARGANVVLLMEIIINRKKRLM